MFGRTTFLDQIGRDYNGIERGVSTRVQELWTNFIMAGIPSQARSHSWTQWSKFTPNDPIHYWLKDGRITPRGYLNIRDLQSIMQNYNYPYLFNCIYLSL